jgi:hypothetical protein
MENILLRDFLAIDFDGNRLRVTDIVQLIKDFGITRFLATYGFDFGKIDFENECLRLASGYKIYEYKKVARTEFKYILEDGFGRHYCPYYILSLMEEHYPVAFKCLLKKTPLKWHERWRMGRGYASSRVSKKDAQYKEIPFGKWRWRANQMLQEENIKPIRNIKQFYICPYDDVWLRETERNWKSFRKKQYK